LTEFGRVGRQFSPTIGYLVELECAGAAALISGHLRRFRGISGDMVLRTCGRFHLDLLGG